MKTAATASRLFFCFSTSADMAVIHFPVCFPFLFVLLVIFTIFLVVIL